MERTVDKEITRNFLKRFFYDRWDSIEKGPGLTLVATNACDHRCKYCYIQGQTVAPFPIDAAKPENILSNAERLFDWINTIDKRPAKIDIFSGEIFAGGVGFKLIELMLDKLQYNFSIVIPTNMSFIFSDEKTEKVIDLINRSCGRIQLSASVDGPYMESNRPFADGRQRDEMYYKRLRGFSEKIPIGYHPMVYSEGIEHWIENFEWFLDMLPGQAPVKYSGLYLLEVRNRNWSKERIIEYGKFIRHVVRFVISNDLPLRTFNIITTGLCKTGRGVGCTLQSNLEVRLGDLVCVPCHRLMYEQFWYFKYDKNFDVVPLNTDLMLAIHSFGQTASPVCNGCLISDFCQKGCLGSQYESMGDMFVPIPSVCRLLHYKTFCILDELKKLGAIGKLEELIGYPAFHQTQKFMEVHRI